MTPRPPVPAYEVTRLEEVAVARAAVRAEVAASDVRLADAAALVASELITNALLHAGGWAEVTATTGDGCARVTVADRETRAPVVGVASDSAMTGRGLRLVAAYSRSWGVTPRADGKEVWAEVTGEVAEDALDDLFVLWDDDLEVLAAPRVASTERRYIVTLGDVPTNLLLAAKGHVDNLVREFTLAESGADSGATSSVPSHLATLIETVANRFAEARDAIKRQAIEAHRRGHRHTHLELRLPASAAAAGEAYLAGLDEVDAYCRAKRLLTLETPPAHRVFRHWYIEELVRQLNDAAAGVPRTPARTFEERLIDELTTVSTTQRVAERAARLYRVAEALSAAVTAEDVADAVLSEGVAALAASGGGLLLATGTSSLAVPGTVGYSPDVVKHLQSESADAALPAATALRTGEEVWLESVQDRDTRFPDLAGMEASTQSICAVPLVMGRRRLGALRFSFDEPRLFDDDQRGFTLALASLCAQALDRALNS